MGHYSATLRENGTISASALAVLKNLVAAPSGQSVISGALSAFALGLIFSSILTWLLRENRHEGWQSEIDRRADDRTEVIRGQIMRSLEVLHGIESFLTERPDVSREEFRGFVSNALLRQQELQALSWDPRVSRTEREEWEKRAQKEGFVDFRFTESGPDGGLVPAVERGEYFPVFYLESLAKNAQALGFNVGSEPRRRVAMDRARDTGHPIASAPIRLAQEPASQLGFVVFLPLYSYPVNTVEDRRSALKGFAAAVFRIGDLIDQSLEDLSDNGVALTLSDEQDQSVVFRQPGERLSGYPSRRTFVDVCGRRWSLLFEPLNSFPKLGSDHIPWIVGSSGFLISVLLSIHLWKTAAQAAAIRKSQNELLTEVIVRKEAEAKAEAASRAKSEFLASMSHEIRTPMNAILGYAQILARDGALPRFHRDAVATILRSGDHLLHLIHEILDLSKIDAGRMEVATSDFDLSALMRELTAMFQQPCEEKHIGLRVEAPALETAVMVHGDEGKLRQILINLLGNAVKFTSRGRVVLRARILSEVRWRFEVEDTGAGIPESSQQSIFEPFQQEPSSLGGGGTGLGLAIARRQVEILGGEIGLNSREGSGSCFFIELNLSQAAACAQSRAKKREILRLVPGHDVRALVVDDIPENREVLANLLTLIGCEVVLAENGRQAVEVARISRPQIVYMDMRMPEFDGIEATRCITASIGEEEIKIVATSASVLTQERERYLQAGCDDFVAKPFRAERIYSCLKDLLGVEFVYKDEAVTDAGDSIDLLQLTLPEDLAARLTMAAELHSATVLKGCLVEMDLLGPHGQRLAQHLRTFLSSYDMKTIQRIIAQIPTV